MALEDSYNLIKQMAADSDEAEMMKDLDFRVARERAEQEAQTTPDPPPIDLEAIAKEHLWQYYAQQQPSQETEMER